jgi:putative phosphonate metabolism protein
MNFTRYAIYYVPPPSEDWVRFATSWLGWDMQTGQAVSPPQLPDLPLPLNKITHAPQKYGLHATLKPPFRLASGVDPEELESACADLSQSLAPVSFGPLRLTRLGQFLALCPPGSASLSALGAACVRQPDHLRAAPGAQEIARRTPDKLTQGQRENLMNWGYPYVLDDFRFHITLTGRLSKLDLEAARNVLDSLLTPLLPRQMTLADLALAGEDTQGKFHLIRRFALSG